METTNISLLNFKFPTSPSLVCLFFIDYCVIIQCEFNANGGNIYGK